MKKILFINRHNLSFTGGIEMHITKFIENLDSNKYKVAVLSYYDKKKLPKDEHSLETGFFGFLKFRYDKYDIIFIENFNILPHFFVILKLFLLRLLGKNSYKVIFVPHGGFVPYWDMFSLPAKIIKKIYHKTFGELFVRYIVGEIIAVSSWEKDVLSKVNKNKRVTVIGNGMPSIDISLKNIRKKRYFVFVGRIDPIKDILLTIKTFGGVINIKKFKDYKLLIVGPFNSDNDYYEKLVNYVNIKNLTDKVKFVGPKYGSEKYKIIAESQCLFCMSKFETDPIVVKEALSVGTKVCIAPNYGLKDYINNKNIFSIKKIGVGLSEFADFINNDFQDEALDKILISWKEMVKKYEKIF